MCGMCVCVCVVYVFVVGMCGVYYIVCVCVCVCVCVVYVVYVWCMYIMWVVFTCVCGGGICGACVWYRCVVYVLYGYVGMWEGVNVYFDVCYSSVLYRWCEVNKGYKKINIWFFSFINNNTITIQFFEFTTIDFERRYFSFCDISQTENAFLAGKCMEYILLQSIITLIIFYF